MNYDFAPVQSSTTPLPLAHHTQALPSKTSVTCSGRLVGPHASQPGAPRIGKRTHHAKRDRAVLRLRPNTPHGANVMQHTTLHTTPPQQATE